MTAQRLDADEVILTDLTDSMGRQQETTVINESGLYTFGFYMISAKVNADKEKTAHKGT